MDRNILTILSIFLFFLMILFVIIMLIVIISLQERDIIMLENKNKELKSQLKQSPNSKAIEVLKQVKETIIKNISPIIFQDSSWLGKQMVLDEIDNQITELKGGEND